MIQYKSGNILTEDAEALVNTVNCVGVMGRGIALQFKNAFPENFKAYAAACKRKEVQPGQMFIFETNTLTNPKFIVNFPTKRHWRGKSRIDDVRSGMDALVAELQNRKIRSIAIPPLGSGLGGLNWAEVRSLIKEALIGLDDVQVVIYEPKGAPEADAISNSREVPTITKGRASLVALLDRYLAGLLDPSVTLLELHKLMYFMQVSGEPLRLKYRQALYGPYAENLRHVLNKIEGHMVSGYADGGDAPDKELKLVPGAIRDADIFLEDNPSTKARIARVSDLVEGFETPFGLELLATIHWAATKMGADSIDDVIAKTYSWNERKKGFSERQISIAYDVLKKQEWLNSSI
ncbi:MAG: macro domain-containing protein [Rhodospirillaceae bacterium]|jgi:O-acetyl-ADP-ribose deacetylase (regulator of RNase III)|nr:macro domain-containing protein [Rhodospirillaceae bacterium]MBT5079013.1 macro domain-containing protein [Rhodospirillaceae bacterium]